MELCGSKVKMCTSAHIQTDSSSEIMNRMIANYLLCYLSLNQTSCDSILTDAKFAYNSAVRKSTTISPFELDLEWQHRIPIDQMTGKEDWAVQSIQVLRTKLKESSENAEFCFKLAQARLTACNGRKYTAPSYMIADRVLLRRENFLMPSPAFSQHENSTRRTSALLGYPILSEKHHLCVFAGQHSHSSGRTCRTYQTT